MNYTTAQELKNLLESKDIYHATGSINMTLNDISVKIKQNDIIGNALQEWLGEFLLANNIYFRPSQGQTFPDFFFSEDDTKNLCEMKTYYAPRQAGFDIANFYGYIDSLRNKAYRLESDYLIFSYLNDDKGNISIKEIWCKKVWEITGPATDYDLKCQRKKGQIVNIRPANWKSDTANLKPFNSRAKFIVALYKTYMSVTNQTKVTKAWLDEVLTNYKHHTGRDIEEEVKSLL